MPMHLWHDLGLEVGEGGGEVSVRRIGRMGVFILAIGGDQNDATARAPNLDRDSNSTLPPSPFPDLWFPDSHFRNLPVDGAVNWTNSDFRVSRSGRPQSIGFLR